MPTHVIDTNVLITAYRDYYAFEICPGFWNCLEHHALANRIVSIDRVLGELRLGKDALKTWAQRRVLRPFFAASNDAAVVTRYAEIMRWVDARAFTPAAKVEFARGADGWVVAYAKVHNLSVVTLETSDPQSKKRVKIPDVCIEVGVPYENTFDMLRALDSRLEWTA